jgi:hypothetical protein
METTTITQIDWNAELERRVLAAEAAVLLGGKRSAINWNAELQRRLLVATGVQA